MKIIFSGLILLFTLFNINAQTKLTIKVEVDEKVELAVIAARLAGFEEFVQNNLKDYAQKVDAHFGKHKDHELIQFAKKLRQTNGIAYSQYLALPVHLKADFTPKVAFTQTVPHKDFGKQNALEFARLLKKFYKDAECEKFFKVNAEMYRQAEARYQKVVDQIDFPWFQKFFGERPNGIFHIYIGLLAGSGNFGEKVIYPNEKTDLFAIMGATQQDEKGIPVFSTEAELPIVIHEFCHSFINHLVDSNPKPFEASCTKIYKLVAEKMNRQAYSGWQTPLNESLVRASVIRYLFDHQGIETAKAEIIGEQGGGFVWMDELFVLLGTYDNNRLKYPTFRSFMPILAGYHNDLVKRVEDKIINFEGQKPKITTIEQFKNGAQDVEPNLKEITFVFSRPLRGKGVSINEGSLGDAGFPEVEKGIGFYNADATKFTLKVKLKPDTNYELVMTGGAFISKDGYPLQDYVVKFKTKKE